MFHVTICSRKEPLQYGLRIMDDQHRIPHVMMWEVWSLHQSLGKCHFLYPSALGIFQSQSSSTFFGIWSLFRDRRCILSLFVGMTSAPFEPFAQLVLCFCTTSLDFLWIAYAFEHNIIPLKYSLVLCKMCWSPSWPQARGIQLLAFDLAKYKPYALFYHKFGIFYQ